MLFWLTLVLLANYPPEVLTVSSSTALFPPICTSPSESQPNPIASDYPGVGIGTGTSNGTLAVIPIEYATARSIVPAQYPILKDTYHRLFPTLAPDMYPVSVQFDDNPWRSIAKDICQKSDLLPSDVYRNGP